MNKSVIKYTNNQCQIVTHSNHNIIDIYEWEVIEEYFKDLLSPKNYKTYYKTHKRVKELIEIRKMLNEFRNIKSEVKVVNGKTYVFLKGKIAGIRKYIKGVRYGAKSLQHVTLGIAKSKLTKRLSKGNVFFSIVTNIGFKVIEYFMKENWFWLTFWTDIGIDIIKDLTSLAAATGAGLLTSAIIAKALAGGVAVTTATTVLPLVVAIGVGFVVGKGLEYIIEKYQIKKALEKALQEFFNSIKSRKNQFDTGAKFYLNEAEKRIYHLYGVSPELLHY